jgi:hypothetical protein
MKNRSIKIEKRPTNKDGTKNFSVVKFREDGVGWSVGSAHTITEAKKIKQKHLWSKDDFKRRN